MHASINKNNKTQNRVAATGFTSRDINRQRIVCKNSEGRYGVPASAGYRWPILSIRNIFHFFAQLDALRAEAAVREGRFDLFDASARRFWAIRLPADCYVFAALMRGFGISILASGAMV